MAARKAGGGQVEFSVLDPTALGRLAVGQKVTIDEKTGKVSLQDFHFTAKVNTSSPKMMMAMPGVQTAVPAGPRQVMINGRLLTGNHLLDTAAVVCSNLAIAYGSVSVVSAFQGIQPLFVMMFAGIASRFFTNKQLRLAKAPQTMRVAVAVMLSVIGLWALS